VSAAPLARQATAMAQSATLQGSQVALEALAHRHVDGLAAAAAADPTLYRWSPVPQGRAEVTRYVESALAARDAGRAVPFAIVRVRDGQVLGSTRFFELERWAWPVGHPFHGRGAPDAGEIGYTWLTAAAVRTAANTEAKLLMLTQAFATWRVLRVCFHTDARNARSRAAIQRIGARFDGVLRAHMPGFDGAVRDTAYYSILAGEWPVVKDALARRALVAPPPLL